MRKIIIYASKSFGYEFRLKLIFTYRLPKPFPHWGKGRVRGNKS